MELGVRFDDTGEGLRNFVVREILEQHSRHFLAPWHLKSVEAVAMGNHPPLLGSQHGVATTENARNQLVGFDSRVSRDDERTLHLRVLPDLSRATTSNRLGRRECLAGRGRGTRHKI